MLLARLWLLLLLPLLLQQRWPWWYRRGGLEHLQATDQSVGGDCASEVGGVAGTETSVTNTGGVLGGSMQKCGSFACEAGESRAYGTRGAWAPDMLFGRATAALAPGTSGAVFMEVNIDRFCA